MSLSRGLPDVAAIVSAVGPSAGGADCCVGGHGRTGFLIETTGNAKPSRSFGKL